NMRALGTHAQAAGPKRKNGKRGSSSTHSAPASFLCEPLVKRHREIEIVSRLSSGQQASLRHTSKGTRACARTPHRYRNGSGASAVRDTGAPHTQSDRCWTEAGRDP